MIISPNAEPSSTGLALGARIGERLELHAITARIRTDVLHRIDFLDDANAILQAAKQLPAAFFGIFLCPVPADLVEVLGC